MSGMTFLPCPCLERPGWGVLVLADRFRSRLSAPPPQGTPAAQSSGPQGRHLWGGLTSSAPTWAQGTPQPPQTDSQLEFLAWPCPALPSLNARLCPPALPGHGSPLLTPPPAAPALVPGCPDGVKPGAGPPTCSGA